MPKTELIDIVQKKEAGQFFADFTKDFERVSDLFCGDPGRWDF